jgi:enoyl-CoA hydratase/carnithine racemase
MCSPSEAVDAGFLDELRPLDEVDARAVEVATQLAAYVHAVPFRTTRGIVRGRLADELREGLANDLAMFDVN